MSYVDGFVVPVKKDRIEEYRALSEKAGKLWKRHGALQYRFRFLILARLQ